METINYRPIDWEQVKRATDSYNLLDKSKILSPVSFVGKRSIHFDFSAGSQQLGHPENFSELGRFTRHVDRLLSDASADYGYGGYNESRPFYSTELFTTASIDGKPGRSVHLGIDIWGAAGTPILAPLDAKVHSTFIDSAPGSYGPTIVLEHDLEGGRKFYTLYGHLSVADIASIGARPQVRRGDQIASFGGPEENGGWPPHLHFQVILDMIGLQGDFPGVAYARDAEMMLKLCPDPNPFFGLPSSD